MPKKLKLFLARFRFPRTLARTRYRIHLWQLYRGEKKCTIEYHGGYVKVANPSIELHIKNFNTVYTIGAMFKSTPSGQFIMDEGGRTIELTEADKAKGFQNPFAEEEKREMATLGRILTVRERRHRSLLKLMDKAEAQKFGD